MRLKFETLRSQRDQDQQTWIANPEDSQAAARLVQSNELLPPALAGATESN